MLDTAAVSLALPNPLAKWGWSPAQVALIVGLHDIGKADAGFQHQDPALSEALEKAGFPKACEARCRHERLSAKFVRHLLLKHSRVSKQDADTVGRAIVAHHGYWHESGGGAPYEDAQKQLCSVLMEQLGLSELDLPSGRKDGQSALGMRLAGHIVLCDWIASNEKFYAEELSGLDNPEDYFQRAREVAAAWVKRLGLERTSKDSKPARIVESPRPIQKVLLDTDIPPGLVIIEAPMGEGKTEAAWILAEKWREYGYTGAYMALPTMATSESLFARYRNDLLKRLERGEEAYLVHGMAWLRDDKEFEKPPTVGEPFDDRTLAAAWFRPTRRAMLAAHGVGTVDQAMLAAMHVKFGFLRLFGLADRVLVIDEIHAYDAYMSAIIRRLLQWCACLEIPVVLLSATLSAKQRASMVEAYGATGGDPGPEAPYPLITIAQPGKPAATIEVSASSSRTLKLETHEGLLGDAKKTAAKARELVRDGGCCCVILNTVKQAQAVYEALGTDVPKLLFHARFTASDRERITEQVIRLFGKGASNRPQKFILVATQVVEQSLDVDFDHMISELAPMDLLLQRSGRLHRHRQRDADPVLHVLLPNKEPSGNPKFGATERIYYRYPLLSTLCQLEKCSTIKLPGAFRMLIETTYGDALPETSMQDMQQAKSQWDDLQEDLAAQAGEFLLCEPMEDEFDPAGHDEVGDDSDDGNGWRARTRIGLEDVLVIPIVDGNARDLAKGEMDRDEVQALYRMSVKIPPYSWPPKPSDRFEPPVLGEGKLRGVWLLPVKSDNGGWLWSGSTDQDKAYVIRYEPLAYDRNGFLIGGKGLIHGGE